MRGSSLSLTTRLWMGVGGIVGFLVASLAGYQYATIMTGNAFVDLLHTEVAMDRDVSRAKACMLQCRRSEKGFILHRDQQYAARFDEELAQLLAQCKTIRASAQNARYTDMADQAMNAATLSDRYGRAFQRVVAAWRQRGLDYDAGLQGHLREVMHLLTDRMKQHALDDVNHDLSELREAEKDCLRQASIEHVQEWQAAAENMRVCIGRSTCNEETRQRLSEYLTRYQELQQNYLEARLGPASAGSKNTTTPSDRETPPGPEPNPANGSGGRTAPLVAMVTQLDDALDIMAREVDRMNVCQVNELILGIRMSEKDYLQRNQDQYVRQTHEAIQKLLDALERSKIDPQSLEQARFALNEYQRAFDELVAEDRTIAVNMKTMDEAVHQLEPIMRSLSGRIEQLALDRTKTVEARANLLTKVAMLAGVVSGLLAFGLAFVLPSAIVGPIQKCTAFAQTIARGNLGGRLEIRRKDEVGGLATALNQMAGDLGQMVHDIKEAGEREKAAQVERAEQERRAAEAEQREAAEVARRRQEHLEAQQRQERELANQERRRAEEEQRKAAVLRRKVDRLLEVVAAAAEGDLTRQIEIEGNEPVDELAVGIQRMLQELAGIIAEVTQSTDQFAEGSFMIAQSTQTLALGAQAQGVSLEQMNSSITELTRSIKAVKDNSSNADKVARETTLLAEEGGQAIQKSAEAMELMRQSAKQIGDIIQVISEIADQTNLLALNAAIEAARAGQHGLGFAVVADEVRKLAERSNQATDEIAKLIRQSTQRVEEGAELSDMTGKSLKRIIAGVESTAQGISQIAQLTIEQATIATEVSSAVVGIAKVTEQVTSGSEEMAASSEQLGANADRLRTVVSRFRI